VIESGFQNRRGKEKKGKKGKKEKKEKKEKKTSLSMIITLTIIYCNKLQHCNSLQLTATH